MARNEFTKPTMREALRRSGMICEAIGKMYGLDDGKRCGTSLDAGVEFDHIILDANSKDNSLENCAAVCIKCHSWKTAKHDIPLAAKTLRTQDKHNGIKRKKQKIPSAGFPPPDKQPTKRVSLPPRRLYERIG